MSAAAAMAGAVTGLFILALWGCQVVDVGIEAIRAALASKRWRPMATATKDRTLVLLLTKADLRTDRDDLEGWRGIQFVGRYIVCEDGWNIAAPVGASGGFPDDWLVGWMPLPAVGGAK